MAVSQAFVAVPVRSRLMTRTALQLVRLAVWTFTGALFCVALLLLSRRWTGGTSRPLGSWLVVLTGCVLALTGLGLRAAIRQCERCRPENLAGHFLRWSTPGAVIVLLGIALTVPRAETWPLGLFWLMLLGGEAVSAWFAVKEMRRSRVSLQGDPSPSDAEDGVAVGADEKVIDRASASGSSVMTTETHQQPDELSPEVTQQFSRSYLPAGGELIHGLVRAEFVAGERHKSVHVAFCPPLDRAPRIEVECQNGPEAKVRPAQAMPYGVRLDVRLTDTPSRPECVVLQFQAVAQVPSSEPPAE